MKKMKNIILLILTTLMVVKISAQDKDTADFKKHKNMLIELDGTIKFISNISETSGNNGTTILNLFPQFGYFITNKCVIGLKTEFWGYFNHGITNQLISDKYFLYGPMIRYYWYKNLYTTINMSWSIYTMNWNTYSLKTNAIDLNANIGYSIPITQNWLANLQYNFQKYPQ